MAAPGEHPQDTSVGCRGCSNLCREGPLGKIVIDTSEQVGKFPFLHGKGSWLEMVGKLEKRGLLLMSVLFLS